MSEFQRQHGERKACEACARAKAKCIFNTSSDAEDAKCERCLRLSKSCTPQAPPAKKRKVAKPNVSRGYQMEKKLDSIVNLLAARESGEKPVENGQASTAQPFATVAHLFPGPNGNGAPLRPWRSDAAITGGKNADPIYEGELPEYPLPNVKVPYHEMEKLVDSWRPQLAEHFPFAALYEGQSTAYLLVEMPFFATAIACAALYGDLSRQIDTAQALIKDIGERMLLQGEKSLDLLLGILVLLAWYHFHVFSNPQVSNLHHLAAALLVDLGLNRPPDRMYAQKWQLFGLRFIHGPSAHKDIRSMSERRALVGCYYMSNVIWSTFKKMNSTPWSDHIEEALQKLHDAQELPSDLLMVYLVKGQRLLESVELGLGLKSPEEGSTLESPAQVLLYVSAFSADLKQQKLEMPVDVSENLSIRLTYFEVEVMIYDIAFQHLNALALRQKGDPHTRSVKRLEYLRHALQSCKAFCDALLAVNPAEFYRHSFHTWARMCRILMVVARINQVPDLRNIVGDLGTIIDFNWCVENFARRYDEAEASARAAGHPLGENHLFSRWAWRLRTFREVNEQAHNPETIHHQTCLATFPGDDPFVPGGQEAATAKPTAQQLSEPDDVSNAELLAGVSEPWDEDLIKYGIDYGNAQPQCPMS